MAGALKTPGSLDEENDLFEQIFPQAMQLNLLILHVWKEFHQVSLYKFW